MRDFDLSAKIVLDDGAFAPLRAHNTDAGLDLRTPISVTVPAGGSVVIDTGIHIEIPRGYVGFLKSKSGLNVNHGIVSEGVIDAGYTGSIRVKLYNLSDVAFDFLAGDKVTQLVILPVITPKLELVKSLAETERGDGGFGSTGR
jgi:dUTP pyrophosphatase